MITNDIPMPVVETLIADATDRDRATARRWCLLSLLWQERYLTREQLVARLEEGLGKGCFGGSAWKDTFYRDMRVVRQAFMAAGYELTYSRDCERPGYYLDSEPVLGTKLAAILDGSVAEVDLAQIAVFKEMTLSERFRLGNSISNTAREVVAYRIRQRNPQLSIAQANRQALCLAYDDDRHNL